MVPTSISSVAVIILNWNGYSDTLACLDSFSRLVYERFKIILVDNGSTDNSTSIIEDYIKKIQIDVVLLKNDKNLGFAGGVNTGIKYAIENDFDLIALFNNDAVVDPYWLTSLVNEMKPKTGIITGLLLNSDATAIDTTGEQYSTWGLPFPRNRGDAADKLPDAGPVFGATGGASLYQAELFKQIGLFDEDFFAYYEDADVSFRAQLAGWRVVYTPEAVAYHKQGATSAKIPGFTTYQAFKNLPLLFLKNVPRDMLFSIGIRFYLSYILILGNAIKNGAGIPALKGVLKAIQLTPSALAKRKAIQKNKVVSTEYLKSILWPDLPPDQTGLRKFRKLFTRKG